MARHRQLPEADQIHYKVIAHYDKTLLPEYCRSIAQDNIARKLPKYCQKIAKVLREYCENIALDNIASILPKYCMVGPYCQIIGIPQPPVI
jgi:4-alpha-glucanotransferase